MRFSLLSRYSGVFPFHLSRLSVRPLSTPRLEEWIPASKKTLRSEEGDEFDESQTLQRSISYLNTDNAKPFLQAMANSRWLWLYKAIGVYTRQKAAFAAWTLYADTVEHILKPNFYKNLGIESQFSSQNELLLLHIWMLKERFMTASKDSNSEERSMGQSLKENLFSKLWEHHRYVVLVSGTAYILVTKARKDLHLAALDSCLSYDRAMDKILAYPERYMDLWEPLDEPIHKLVFFETPGTTAIVARLRNYVKAERARLDKFSMEDLVEGRFKWENFPSDRYSSKLPGDR